MMVNAVSVLCFFLVFLCSCQVEQTTSTRDQSKQSSSATAEQEALSHKNTVDTQEASKQPNNLDIAGKNLDIADNGDSEGAVKELLKDNSELEEEEPEQIQANENRPPSTTEASNDAEDSNKQTLANYQGKGCSSCPAGTEKLKNHEDLFKFCKIPNAYKGTHNDWSRAKRGLLPYVTKNQMAGFVDPRGALCEVLDTDKVSWMIIPANK